MSKPSCMPPYHNTRTPFVQSAAQVLRRTYVFGRMKFSLIPTKDPTGRPIYGYGRKRLHDNSIERAVLLVQASCHGMTIVPRLSTPSNPAMARIAACASPMTPAGKRFQTHTTVVCAAYA